MAAKHPLFAKFSRALLIGGVSLFAATTFAEEVVVPPKQQKKPDADEVDPLANAKVTIIKKRDRVIEEHRVNGQLIMVKVIPSKGKPYYIMDTDGDGKLDEMNGTAVNQWKVITW